MNIICFITTSLAFLPEVDVKKPEKLAYLAKIDEGNHHILWTTWWISIKFSRKTYDDSLSDQKSGLHSLNLLSCEHRNPFAKIYQRTHEHPTNSLAELKSHEIQNHNNIIFPYLNINSIRNKFDNLKLIIDEHVGILCVTETKIDKSFPTAQFSWIS